MASLFVKDPEANALAVKAAALQGKTKTQAVKDALREVVDRLELQKSETMVEWIKQRRAERPLKPTGRVADKAFYDSLWGDA